MKKPPAGSHADMFEKYFPGEAYTTSFEPSPEQRVVMTRHAQQHAHDGEELKSFLMAFGLLPYDVRPDTRFIGACKNGHDRATHSRLRGDGYVECRTCKRAADKQRHKKKAAA